MFNLKCSHNVDDKQSSISTKQIKPCYKSEIVYGTTQTFQADILKYEYY